jgi:hypothetical protein
LLLLIFFWLKIKNLFHSAILGCNWLRMIMNLIDYVVQFLWYFLIQCPLLRPVLSFCLFLAWYTCYLPCCHNTTILVSILVYITDSLFALWVWAVSFCYSYWRLSLSICFPVIWLLILGNFSSLIFTRFNILYCSIICNLDLVNEYS